MNFDPKLTALAPAFDVEAIRADFPILSQRVHGKPLGVPRQRGFGAEAAWP